MEVPFPLPPPVIPENRACAEYFPMYGFIVAAFDLIKSRLVKIIFDLVPI